MYKFIFELITDPLGLPISVIWEYIILIIINEIAFRIAWNTSPGGRFGSEIHWAVRILVFIILWAIIYGIIFLVKWIYLNIIIVLSIVGVIILVVGILKIIVLFMKQRNRKKV